MLMGAASAASFTATSRSPTATIDPRPGRRIEHKVGSSCSIGRVLTSLLVPSVGFRKEAWEGIQCWVRVGDEATIRTGIG